MKNIFLRMMKKSGESLRATMEKYPDIKEAEFWDIYNLCKPFTMTSVERMYALYCSVDHIVQNGIQGEFVECGVWRGGSSMLIAKMLSNRNIIDRKIYLYDTFEGMPEPTKNDFDLRGKTASVMLRENEHNKETSVWCVATLTDVQNNMRLTQLPAENVVYVKGKVETTIPGTIPHGNIALLRLDTDWYESTKHELTYLYPKVALHGIVIIDDYGHWAGCRKAVDEYRKENNITILLNRIDYTGRVGVKTSTL